MNRTQRRIAAADPDPTYHAPHTQAADLPPVLVSCPTFDGKAYALDRYVAAVRAQDYPDTRLLLVDNSPDLVYTERITSLGVDCAHTPRPATLAEAFNRAWYTAACEAWRIGAPFILNLEQDVIIPPRALSAMVFMAVDRGLDVVGAYVPFRAGGSTRRSVPGASSDLGCILVATDVWRRYFETAEARDEEWTYGRLSRLAGPGREARFGGLFEVEHLHDPGTVDYWPFAGPDGRVMAAEVGP